VQLTREQYAIAESLGCRFLPATESQIHRLSMQQRIFWLDGKAFVVSRRDGFHETAGTLRRLLAHAPAPSLPAGPSGDPAAAPPADVPPPVAARVPAPSSLAPRSLAPRPSVPSSSAQGDAAPPAAAPQAPAPQAPAPQAPAPRDAAPRDEAPPAVEASPPPPAQDAPAPPPAGSVARPRRIGGRTATRAPEQPALALQDASPDTPDGTLDSPAEAAPGKLAAQPLPAAAPPEPVPVAPPAPGEGEEVRADAAVALLAGAGLGSLGALLQPGALEPAALARKRPRKQVPGLLAPKKRDPVSLTVQIVAAHVSNNAVQTTDLPSLIAEVHRALTGPVAAVNGEPVRPPPVEPSLARRRAEGAQKG